ncbi:hypothetical protein THAOC_26445, partial [Thalassiosira oceanica]
NTAGIAAANRFGTQYESTVTPGSPHTAGISDISAVEPSQHVSADRPEGEPQPERRPPDRRAPAEKLFGYLRFAVPVDAEVEPLEGVPKDHRRGRPVQDAGQAPVRPEVA